VNKIAKKHILILQKKRYSLNFCFVDSTSAHFGSSLATKYGTNMLNIGIGTLTYIFETFVGGIETHFLGKNQSGHDFRKLLTFSLISGFKIKT